MEEQVQPFAANLWMVKNLTEALLSIAFTLFIGPWSDKFGRKPLLISTTTGFLLTYTSLLILYALKIQISTWFYVLAFGFVALLGGHVTLFVAIYCYVTDTSTEETRSTNLVVLEAVLSAGIVAGFISSSYIYVWYGATEIMAIAAIATFITWLWVVFVLRESRMESYTMWEKIRGVFNIEHIRDLMIVCFKSRNGNDRAVLWTVMLSLGSSIFVLQGVECIIFLFVRAQFQWDVRAYTMYCAIATICLILCNLVIMYIVKPITNVSDQTLVVLAFCSACISSVIVAFATKSWHMYLGVAFATLMGILKPMCRSIMATISKRAENEEENEIGKLYSMTATFEAIFPVLSVPLYTMVYKATISSFPGAFNLISSAIWGLCAICLIIAFISHKKYVRRQSYQEITS